MPELIGQILGIIAVVFSILSYQMNTSRSLLYVQTAASGIFCIHYLLIEAYSGLAINFLAIIRNMVLANQNKKIFSHRACPWIFAALMAVMGLVTSAGWHSILYAGAIAINTVCLASPSAQFVRKSILVTCPMVLVYNIIEHSIGGCINETMAMVSAVIGIVRYLHEKKKKASAEATESEENA